MFLTGMQSRETESMKTLVSRYQSFIDKQETSEPRGSEIPAERPTEPAGDVELTFEERRLLNLAKITTRQEVADLQKIGSDVQWLCYIIHKDHDAFDLEMVSTINIHFIWCVGRRAMSQNVKDEFYFNFYKDMKRKRYTTASFYT